MQRYVPAEELPTVLPSSPWGLKGPCQFHGLRVLFWADGMYSWGGGCLEKGTGWFSKDNYSPVLELVDSIESGRVILQV